MGFKYVPLYLYSGKETKYSVAYMDGKPARQTEFYLVKSVAIPDSEFSDKTVYHKIVISEINNPMSIMSCEGEKLFVDVNDLHLFN